MSGGGENFTTAGIKMLRGAAMWKAGSVGAAAGIGMGNSIIAAGFGAACSPFAAVPLLALGGAYLAYKAFDVAVKAAEDSTSKT